MFASTPPLPDGSESFSSFDAHSDAPSLADIEPENARGDDGAQKELKLEVDPIIVEALRSKDRLFVLRLGEQMESLITEQKTQIDVQPSTTYQKLLVHRCAGYYKLRPENDSVAKGLVIIRTFESKIPSRRLSDLVPVELPSAPAFKIMMRGSKDRRSKALSQAGSVAGDDADLSDVEPSESGSIGGRSSVTSKKHMTIEEREAAYKEARTRIFMDFEEKEKEKEKDMSGSSSTRSLVSGSGGETSSVGDIDDSNSTAPTESEWSGPIAHDKREVRRGKGSSNRSLRSSARGSRATSPAFTYASLYEPPVAGSSYDPQMGVPPPQGYVPQYMYPYPVPPGQAPGQGYLAPFPYYAPYPYPHQAYPLTQSEPVSPSGGEMYGPFSPPHVGYNPYTWGPPQQQLPPPGSVQGQPSQPQQSPNQPTGIPQSQPVPQYPLPNAPMYAPPYAPPHMYGQYPMPPYYPAQSAPPPQLAQPMPTSPQMQPQLMYPTELSFANGPSSPARTSANGNGSGNGSANHSRTSSRNGSNHGGRRGAPQARHAWTYGPGVGNYGGNETVGPRLTSSMRRQSGASNLSSLSTGNRTPGDETSSIASSSTSSSSRRTFTSTSTTSKHPLPARPDWAVGLKPQPHRHHDHNNNGNGSTQQQSQPSPPQSTDFPPLTLSPPPKAPVTAGAWTNSSSTRSILMPNAAQPGQPSTYGSALVQYPNSNGNANQTPRLDSQAFERPPPKGSAELFNPKARRPTVSMNAAGSKTSSPPVQDKTRGVSDAAVNTTLADKMGAMTMTVDGKDAALGAVNPDFASSPRSDAALSAS
ncbi:hypothetical protein NEOLEDRAFT_1130422 [Neolentinus lepideus HHB14362 ss-1]|uniref:SUZ domain-containing protein n=1 Tax=Neolentinus lepideus HHB14362 ss-1 TaxID=1314782 RepID=A0A165UBN0_9AGAM|nr:hypothetical protein NEOLEDRAFT_1130422 [Neolentinus lepideus HHB14362 ss-1]